MNGNGKRSNGETVGRVVERLSGVPVKYVTKVKAVLPDTGMKPSDITEMDADQGRKIINQISLTKQIDKIFEKIVRILVFIIVLSAVVAFFVYSFVR